MKEKRLKIFKFAIHSMMIMGLLVCVTSCGRDAKIYENGFFKYIVLGESGPYSDKEVKNAVAIVGFSALGMQQETIDFPKEIDDKPVCYIGYRNWNTFMESFFKLESENLKKVYIHENIKSVYREAFDNDNLEIMLCAPKDPYKIFSNIEVGKYYLYKSVYDSKIFTGNIHEANIVFLDNYSRVVNESYYSLDNIKAGEKISMPSNKLSRNGYEFTGWYTEPECINAWNFDVSPTIEDGGEFKLYAGWRS